MASDGQTVTIPAISLVHGSQAPTVAAVQPSGKVLPQPGKPAATKVSNVRSQVALLNKYLNDSGKPDQFRVDPSSDGKVIQQVNPASEFAALARSVGISGVVLDQHA